MGKKDDPNAVVDTQGRVYGVQGLRIVDASIFPLLPPGHPQATVCASSLPFLFLPLPSPPLPFSPPIFLPSLLDLVRSCEKCDVEKTNQRSNRHASRENRK